MQILNFKKNTIKTKTKPNGTKKKNQLQQKKQATHGFNACKQRRVMSQMENFSDFCDGLWLLHHPVSPYMIWRYYAAVVSGCKCRVITE